MTTAIDIPTGLDEFFKAQGSTEAQRQDAIAIMASKCGMVSGVVILTATGEALDSDNSRKWIEANKPHLLPPRFERSLADRAFADGNVTARGELLKQVGATEALRIAQSYGLKSVHDTARGKAPTAVPNGGQKPNGADHKNNPFHASNWNVSKQGALLRAIGTEKCAAIAASVGSRIGATKPNANY
jgi:hypothetical protein